MHEIQICCNLLANNKAPQVILQPLVVTAFGYLILPAAHETLKFKSKTRLKPSIFKNLKNKTFQRGKCMGMGMTVTPQKHMETDVAEVMWIWKQVSSNCHKNGNKFGILEEM